MPHVIEIASSARAKCRGCDHNIAKGEVRFGERHPNTFGDGEMTLWFHLPCGAYTRPESFLEALPGADIESAAAFAAAAQFGVAYRRVPRVHGAGRAPTGRARCRNCKELIDREVWRIPLVFFEEFRLAPGGFVHAACAAEYFETTDLLARIKHFSPELTSEDAQDLQRVLRGGAAP